MNRVLQAEAMLRAGDGKLLLPCEETVNVAGKLAELGELPLLAGSRGLPVKLPRQNMLMPESEMEDDSNRVLRNQSQVNAMNEQTPKTEKLTAERPWRQTTFTFEDEDGVVRVHTYDEKQDGFVVDEEKTAALDPETIEDIKVTSEVRRRQNNDTCSDIPGGCSDWGHVAGW